MTHGYGEPGTAEHQGPVIEPRQAGRCRPTRCAGRLTWPWVPLAFHIVRVYYTKHGNHGTDTQGGPREEGLGTSGSSAANRYFGRHHLEAGERRAGQSYLRNDSGTLEPLRNQGPRLGSAVRITGHNQTGKQS